MSRTPVETSGDVNVSAASHLSKLPLIATEALTENLIELSSGVIAKTGACARLTNGNTVEAKRHRTANRMEAFRDHVDPSFTPPKRLPPGVTASNCQKLQVVGSGQEETALSWFTCGGWPLLSFQSAVPNLIRRGRKFHFWNDCIRSVRLGKAVLNFIHSSANPIYCIETIDDLRLPNDSITLVLVFRGLR